MENTICCRVNGAMLRDGDTPLECVSVSPAPLLHSAVIFSCVKSAGNSRHSFSFFPTDRKAWTQSGRATQRHFEGPFKVNKEQGFEFLNRSINGKMNIDYHSRCSDPFTFTMIRLGSDFLTLLKRKLSIIIRSQTVRCRPLQDLWGTYKLHLPGGLEGGLLLAEPGGRPLLHADPPGLLPRLRPHRPSPARPSGQRPGAVHRRASAGHLAHDCPGGVEE